MRNALFLLVVMAPVLSADIYSATDCGQPGSALYAECQALFPPIVDTAAPDITTLGYIAGKPPQSGGMPGWFYIPLGASPDGSWVAYGVYDIDGDGALWLWHAGQWQQSVDGVSFSLGVQELTDTGVALGIMSHNQLLMQCTGPNGSNDQFFTAFGCVAQDQSANFADGGFGAFLAINEQGDLFQRGGKFAWTVLSPGELTLPVPEPSAWILLAVGVGIAALLRARPSPGVVDSPHATTGFPRLARHGRGPSKAIIRLT